MLRARLRVHTSFSGELQKIAPKIAQLLMGSVFNQAAVTALTYLEQSALIAQSDEHAVVVRL